MMNRIINVGALITLTLAAGAVFAADVIVLQSNTPNYQPGQVLSFDTAIELADGDELMLASESGALTLTGPYYGPPETPSSTDEQSMMKALDELLGKSSLDTGDLGVVRGDDAASAGGCENAPPQAWAIEVASGERCVPASGSVSFWRDDASQHSTLRVKRIATGENAELAWASGEHSVPWPDSLKQANGETYSVRYDADVRSKNVTLIKMPDGINAEVQIIAWLATQGCRCQAQKIYDDLRQ